MTDGIGRAGPRTAWRFRLLCLAASIGRELCPLNPVDEAPLLPTFSPLAEDGLLGVSFLPPGDGPHPAVIVLGGSEGGLPVRSAAPLLASHGYATLALAYFGLPGLSCGLINIPLEYFGRAIAHVRAAIAPRNDFVAVHGT
jgi:hypothetical protein